MSDDSTPDKFADKMAQFVARSADDDKAKLPERDTSKPQSDDLIDPVLAQQKREIQAEADRKAHLKSLDPTMPDHLAEAAFLDQDLLNTVGKGEMIDLLSKVPSLKVVYLGAGWATRALDEVIDVDMSIFLLDRKDMTREDGDFVFYNNLQTLDGGVRHEGDNRAGSGDGDEESAIIDLNSVPYDITRILIVFSIYEEADNQAHFGLLRNMYLRIVNKEYNEEICRFTLPEEGMEKNSVMLVAALVRDGPRWFLQTLADGQGRGGLAKIAVKHGIVLKELQSTEAN